MLFALFVASTIASCTVSEPAITLAIAPYAASPREYRQIAVVSVVALIITLRVFCSADGPIAVIDGAVVSTITDVMEPLPSQSTISVARMPIIVAADVSMLRAVHVVFVQEVAADQVPPFSVYSHPATPLPVSYMDADMLDSDDMYVVPLEGVMVTEPTIGRVLSMLINLDEAAVLPSVSVTSTERLCAPSTNPDDALRAMLPAHSPVAMS